MHSLQHRAMQKHRTRVQIPSSSEQSEFIERATSRTGSAILKGSLFLRLLDACSPNYYYCHQ
jgi:hypothetical protein